MSKALLKSVVKTCRSCLELRASSSISANTRKGACTPDFDTAPYWLLCRRPLSKTTADTLPTIMCSYHLMMCSISATGRHLLTSVVPLSVFGSNLIRATFNTSGTCPSCLHPSMIATTCFKLLSSINRNRSVVTSESPAAFPAFI